MFGKSRALMVGVMGMGMAAYGAAAEAVKSGVDTFRASATIGTSCGRLSTTVKRTGITTAQQKRAAQKKRNQVRHKAICRG